MELLSSAGLFSGSTTRNAVNCCCSSGFLFRAPLLTAFASPQLPFSKICNLNRGRCSFKKDKGCRICCSQVRTEDASTDEEACELVNGLDLSIGDGTDSIRAYLLTAVKNNNGTGILLLSDIYGFEDSSTRDFAYRVACNGYNVLVPDLFAGDPWAKDKSEAELKQWLAKQSQERVVKNIATSVKWMVDEFVAAGISKKLGIIGFGFGGKRLVDVLAEDQGAYFGIGVSFYATSPIDPSVVANINVPILFIAGDDDPLCPIGDIVRNIAKGSRVKIFKGRGHGFAHRPQSPEDDNDAEQVFMVMRNWLYDGLIVHN